MREGSVAWTPAMTTTTVPLLDLRLQYAPIRDEILATLTRVCDSQRFIMGPEVDGLERELAAMLEVKHAIGVSSGTDALLVAMMALGIGEGDEVVTSTYSFFATAGCVWRLGARPVLADIDPVTYNIEPAAVASTITPRTRAIIPCTSTGPAPTWINPRHRAAGRRGRHRGRGPGDRHAHKGGWWVASGRSGAFHSSPARTSAASATAGW
jgi:histidinol-phosphate/aromatic aminotransferase/cobyric acid decarboxylase-like protein